MPDPELPSLCTKKLSLTAGCKTNNLHVVWNLARNLKRTCTNGSGRAENNDFLGFDGHGFHNAGHNVPAVLQALQIQIEESGRERKTETVD